MVWRLLLLCTCGAVGGGLAEYVHMHAEVWSLPYGQEFPLWIVWVYFCALLGLGLLFARFAHVWRVPGVSRRTLLMELAALNFLAALPPLLHHYEVALAGLVALYLVLRFWLFEARGDLGFVLGIALADLVLELCLTLGAGLYDYRHSLAGPCPLWLPLLWAGMALSLRRLYSWATSRR